MSRPVLAGRGPPGVDKPFTWEPILGLSYLLLLFVPLTWNQTPEEFRTWLYATLLSLPVFLILYWRAYRRRAQLTLVDLLPLALLGYLLIPLNPVAFTYLVYAAIFAPYALAGLVRPLLLAAALVALQAVEIVLLHQPEIPVTLICATVFISLSCVNGYFRVEDLRKNAALKVSHEQIRRLAAVAERARIGRDLHDLLGHTLSLIAVKGSLAQKLAARDLSAAIREMEDVTRTARESLKQVRTAVAGMRSASLEEELSSARELLELSGVRLTCHRDAAALSPEIETVLAMVVRETTTNIHRHAGARRAWIDIQAELDAVTLLVRDDGRGGASMRGNGLAGIESRVGAFGGMFDIDSAASQGTAVRVQLPLHQRAREASCESKDPLSPVAGT